MIVDGSEYVSCVIHYILKTHHEILHQCEFLMTETDNEPEIAAEERVLYWMTIRVAL